MGWRRAARHFLSQKQAHWQPEHFLAPGRLHAKQRFFTSIETWGHRANNAMLGSLAATAAATVAGRGAAHAGNATGRSMRETAEARRPRTAAGQKRPPAYFGWRAELRRHGACLRCESVGAFVCGLRAPRARTPQNCRMHWKATSHRELSSIWLFCRPTRKYSLSRMRRGVTRTTRMFAP